MHEGGSRYKEIRDLYEEKLNKRDSEYMLAKEQLIKAQMMLEFSEKDNTRLKQDIEAKISDHKEAL